MAPWAAGVAGAAPSLRPSFRPWWLPGVFRDAVRALDQHDVVAFTSENGVTRFFHELDAQRLDARAFGHDLALGLRTGWVGQPHAVRVLRLDTSAL